MLALAGLAGLGAAMAQAHSARARTEHADRVLLRSSELERKVVDLETGLRGYAITRDEHDPQRVRCPRIAMLE